MREGGREKTKLEKGKMHIRRRTAYLGTGVCCRREYKSVLQEGGINFRFRGVGELSYQGGRKVIILSKRRKKGTKLAFLGGLEIFLNK